MPVGGKQGSEAFACLWWDVPRSGMVWTSLWKDKLVMKMGQGSIPTSQMVSSPWEMRWNTVLVSENLLLTFLLACDWQWSYCPHTGTNTSGCVCNPQDSREEEAKKLLFPNAPQQSGIHQAGSHQWALGWSPAVVGSCVCQHFPLDDNSTPCTTKMHCTTSYSQRKFPGPNRAACVRPGKQSPKVKEVWLSGEVYLKT